MKYQKTLQMIASGIVASAVGFLPSHSLAQTAVTGWGLESGAANATLTDNGGGSFSITAPTANTAARADLASTIDLSQVGESVQLSGNVTLGSTFNNQQFRFGLFSNNGSSLGTLSGTSWTGATQSGWLGYLVEVGAASGTGNSALYGRSGTGANAWFSSSGAATLITPNVTDTGTYVTTPGSFYFSLLLSRVSATSISISYSFTETDGVGHFSAIGSGLTDAGTSATSSGLTSISAVGFFESNTGGGAATFSNVFVTTPEPSSLAMVGAGVGMLVLLIRRKK